MGKCVNKVYTLNGNRVTLNGKCVNKVYLYMLEVGTVIAVCMLIDVFTVEVWASWTVGKVLLLIVAIWAPWDVRVDTRGFVYVSAQKGRVKCFLKVIFNHNLRNIRIAIIIYISMRWMHPVASLGPITCDNKNNHKRESYL